MGEGEQKDDERIGWQTESGESDAGRLCRADRAAVTSRVRDIGRQLCETKPAGSRSAE